MKKYKKRHKLDWTTIFAGGSFIIALLTYLHPLM